MRMKDYPKTSTIVKGSTYLNVDSAAAGTKAIESDDLRKQLMGFTTKDEYFDFLDNILDGAVYRTSIYRGKNLGNAFTDEQKAHIADGTFKGFFIGDYWKINNTNWRIADIDYWLGTGDAHCWIHHLNIVPDGGIGSASMNDSNTTEGGYILSKMYKTNLNATRNKIKTIFGSDNILEHRELFTNSVTNGYPSAGAWYNSTIDLMNEPMVIGGYECSSVSNVGQAVPYVYTIDDVQLALFRLRREFINLHKIDFWLRDIASSNSFVYRINYGYNIAGGASAVMSIRPIFGLKGA